MNPRRDRPAQDAKARFSEMLMACERDGAQIVTKRGVATAALVPIEEWRRLKAGAGPGLKALLLSDKARTDDLIIPARKTVAERKPPKF